MMLQFFPVRLAMSAVPVKGGRLAEPFGGKRYEWRKMIGLSKSRADRLTCLP